MCSRCRSPTTDTTQAEFGIAEEYAKQFRNRSVGASWGQHPRARAPRLRLPKPGQGSDAVRRGTELVAVGVNHVRI